MFQKQGTDWISYRAKPVAAVLAVGYGVKSYLEMAHQLRMTQIKLMEHENTELKQRNEMLMNMYGDRSSLNNVERAVEFYEKR
jgi:hypothetical protein